MRTLIALTLMLSGCVVQQPMTPEERLIAIEQQRANMEQIRTGLEIMRAGSFAPQQSQSCITHKVGQFWHTTCN